MVCAAPIEADTPLAAVDPAEYDLLVIPGGQSPERLRLREEAIGIARDFMDVERPVAAIGHGPQLLIILSLPWSDTIRP